MSITDGLKSYFNLKITNETKEAYLKGICPNYWSKQACEGQFYKWIKGSKNEKRDNTFNNFIDKIVETNISGSIIDKDTYTSKTCYLSYNQNQ
jgi:hypothetical protein